MALPLAAAAMGAQAVGSIYGAQQARKTAQAAAAQNAEFTNKALAALEAVGVPAEEAMQITLQTPELVFDYAPQLQQQFPEIASSFADIEVDPRLQEAQATALAGIEERAAMGLTPEDRAELAAIQRGAAATGSAQRASALQQMEQRGMGGSGQALMAQLAGAQSAQDLAAGASEQEAAQIFAAKQAALGQLAQVAGAQRGQEFGEQAQQASAADVIAQFNRQQQAGTQAANIAEQNKANLMRQQMLQAQEEQRVAARNLEEEQRIKAKQQQFEMQQRQAEAAAGALAGAGGRALTGGATEAKGQQAMGTALGQLGAGAIKLAGTDSKKKA